MELKDFQQSVLDAFDVYLDTLIEKRFNAIKIDNLIQDDPSLDLEPQDFREKAWNALKAIGKLPRARDKVPFSPHKDGAQRPVTSVSLQ